jgi:hypothetical protein
MEPAETRVSWREQPIAQRTATGREGDFATALAFLFGAHWRRRRCGQPALVAGSGRGRGRP